MSMIPKGTRLLLRRRNRSCFAIYPGLNLVNDQLALNVGITIDGVTLLPRDSVLIGNWISNEKNLQLQVSWMIVGNETLPIDAISHCTSDSISLNQDMYRDYWEYQKRGNVRKSTDDNGKVIKLCSKSNGEEGTKYLICENHMEISVILQEPVYF